MPIPSIPGGHQPAPIDGICSTTQSTILSDGFIILNFDLFSLPPPFAATSMLIVLPGTISTERTHGVLSRVLRRVNAGSAKIEARNLFSGWLYARRTPSSTTSCRLFVDSRRQSCPHLMKTFTIPVSWQIGRCPSAHIRLLVRICAIASLAAGPCSAS